MIWLKLPQILDDSQGGGRSELMTYQPSPYNNNLDLNELLQNASDIESVQNGKQRNGAISKFIANSFSVFIPD